MILQTIIQVAAKCGWSVTANVTIFTMEKFDVLAIPSKALRFAPNETLLMDGESISDCEGDQKVWTKQGNEFKAIPVKVGSTNGTITEILSGLKEGDEIITEFNIMQEATEGEAQNNNPFMPRRPNSNRRGNTNGNGGNQGGGNNQNRPSR